ncbi:MAG: hypothetical protein HY709_09175 [Candidatus Latescibacteria bacterium]|nr:hypothetical protein [Candidatus Latescibacterota bacterium]
MKTLKRFWTFAGLGIAIVAVVTLVGCFDNFAPMAPGEVSDQPGITQDAPSTKLIGTLTEIVSKLIDPLTGGLLVLEVDPLEVSLGISPQASWVGPVTISMGLIQDTEQILDLGFGPDGTQFDPAATLTTKKAKLTGTNIALYWWDPATERWVKLDTPVKVDPDGTITTSISHFSRYGLRDSSCQ